MVPEERTTKANHAQLIVNSWTSRLGMPSVTIDVSESIPINGVAKSRLGHRISLSSDALDVMPDDLLAPVLAHELGHQHARDNRLLVAVVALGVSVLAALGTSVYGSVTGRLGLPGFLSSVGGLGFAFVIGLRRLAMASQRCEFRADRFAADLLGGVNPTIKLLEWCQTVNANQQGWDSTHPPLVARIEALTST